jgi:hypothetical protein
MLKLNLLDANFAGQSSTVPGKTPRLVEWNRTCRHEAPLVVTDWAIAHVGPETRLAGEQFAWLLESPLANAGMFSRSKLTEVEDRFALIFTSEKSRVRANPDKYRYAPVGGIWIKEPAIRNKTLEVSMITSTKVNTPMQQMRSAIASDIANTVDVFGRGRERELVQVEDALCDYRFSIAIENICVDGYWTEKLLNCFATGTVPIYKGAPDIGSYFDERGIVPFDGEETLDLSTSRYRSLKPFIIANFYESLRYEIPDDRLIADHFSHML